MQAMRALLAAPLLCLALSAPSQAAGDPRSAELMAAQSKAMAPLAIFDGTWRGLATITLPDGKTLQITQTERVGSMLGGTLKVISVSSSCGASPVRKGASTAISEAPTRTP